MKTISPCLECPYKLGLVQTFKNPCPQCELEGYKMFEVFRSRTGFNGSKPTKYESQKKS